MVDETGGYPGKFKMADANRRISRKIQNGGRKQDDIQVNSKWWAQPGG
jgi:hypothetical protein